MVVFTSLCASALKFALTLQVEERQALALVHRIQLCWALWRLTLQTLCGNVEGSQIKTGVDGLGRLTVCPTASTRS